MRIVAFVGSPVECNEKDVSKTLNVFIFVLSHFLAGKYIS